MPSVAPHERVVARLLPALQRLLATGGTFTEITVAALMSEAGMSRRTFYVHFDDKAHFIREASTVALGEMLEAADLWWERPPGFTRLELELSIASMVDAYEPHRGVMRAMAETATYDESVAELHDLHLRRVAEGIERHVRDAQRNATASASASVDPATLALWLTTLHSAGLSEFPADATGDARAHRITALAEIVWRTLFARETR